MGATERLSERRQYRRVDKKIVLKFRVIGGPLPADTADRIGMVTNLSQGGVVLLSKRPLVSDVLLDLHFPSTVFGNERTLSGKIVWIRPGPDGDMLHGCQFVKVSEETRKRARKEGPESAAPPAPPSSPKDRRVHKRWEQKLIVRVRCIAPGPFREADGRGAMLQDISKGGVEIVTTRDYVGSAVLEMQFPESPIGPAKMYHGRIVWSRGAEKPGHFLLGCAFVRLPAEKK